MPSKAENDPIAEDVDREHGGEVELQDKFFRDVTCSGKCLLEEETETVRKRKYFRRRVNGTG